MRTCDVCGNATFHEERVEEVFTVEGRMIIVEHIPARICDRCGDATFDRETVEHVRRAIRSGNAPTRHVSVDVFAFV